MIKLQLNLSDDKFYKTTLHHAGDFRVTTNHIIFYKGNGEGDYVLSDDVRSATIFLGKGMSLRGDNDINLMAQLMSMLSMIKCNIIFFSNVGTDNIE